MFGKLELALVGLLVIGIILFSIAVLIGPSSPSAVGLMAFASALLGSSVTLLSRHILTQRDHSQQLRMAAIERRLEAHQEAFSIYRKLATSIFKQDALSDATQEGQTWWDANSLYLEPKAREALKMAINAAGILPAYRDAYTGGNQTYKDLYEDQVNKIKLAGEEIERAVMLPSIAEDIKLRENE